MIDPGVYVVLGEVDLELLTRVARQAVADLEASEAEAGAPTLEGLERPVLVQDVAGWSLIVSPMRGTSTLHLQLDHGEDAALAVEALPKIAAELSRSAHTVACAWLRPEEGSASIAVWREGATLHTEQVSSRAGPTEWPLSGLIAGVGRASAAADAAISARTITVPLDAPLDAKAKDELAALRRDAGASPATAPTDAERLAKCLTREGGAAGATAATPPAPPQNLTALYVILGLLVTAAVVLMIVFSIMASKRAPI